MPNIVKVTVENPDEILNTGAYGAGALVRLQSAATQAGAFADVSGTGSTPTLAIVTGTRIYTGYDPAGTSSSWYRTRYENAGGTRVSDWADAFQVGDETAGLLCSLYDAKQRLGIAATDTASDEDLLDHIADVSSWIQGKTHRTLLPDPLSGTRTYLFDGYDALEDGRCLLLPRGIRTISLLRAALYTGAAFTTIPSTDYFLQPSQVELEPGWPYTELWMTDIPSVTNTAPYFQSGFANIEITGAFGWAAVPREIRTIALNLVNAAWKARSGSGGETVTIGIDGERIIEKSLSSQEWRTLNRYTYKAVVIV